MIRISAVDPVTREKLKNIHKARQFQLQYPKFILSKAEKFLNEMVIPLIKGRMEFKKYDKKIIDSTRIENVTIDLFGGNIGYDTVCDYVSVSGFDISTAREKTGTKRHFIKPLKKKALHFIVRGVAYFSKGHWVKGIVASFIIADSMKEMEPFVEKRLQDSTDELFEKVMGVKL